MSNYILKYARDERVKYISHLDFVRLFHRAVRRANIPFVFSQGFNPHPVMTVAQPLSVGVTSDCEYMKVGFEGDFQESVLVDRINAALPPGYRILAAKRIEGKEIDLTKLDRGIYTVEAEVCGNFDAESFLAHTELKVMKKTKSGVKETDIRPYIYDFTVLSHEGNNMVLKMNLALGSSCHVKPDTVIAAMEQYTEDFSVSFFQVHRNKMLFGETEYLK